MIVNKPLQLRGYTVTGRDNRSGKPFSDIIALDAEIIQSGKAWGMKSADMIEAKYNRLGLRVTEIKRKQNVIANINLTSLYRPELVGLDGSYDCSNLDMVEDKIHEVATHTLMEIGIPEPTDKQLTTFFAGCYLVKELESTEE